MSGLDDLARLNDEEWADKPYLIELRGGKGDGERLRLPNLPEIWRRPEPRPVTLGSYTEPLPLSAIGPPTAQYRRTGNVRDDGAHIYAFYGFEP